MYHVGWGRGEGVKLNLATADHRGNVGRKIAKNAWNHPLRFYNFSIFDVPTYPQKKRLTWGRRARLTQNFFHYCLGSTEVQVKIP